MSDSLIHLMIVLGVASGPAPVRLAQAPGAGAAPATAAAACRGGAEETGSIDKPCAAAAPVAEGATPRRPVAAAARAQFIARQPQR